MAGGERGSRAAGSTVQGPGALPPVDRHPGAQRGLLCPAPSMKGLHQGQGRPPTQGMHTVGRTDRLLCAAAPVQGQAGQPHAACTGARPLRLPHCRSAEQHACMCGRLHRAAAAGHQPASMQPASRVGRCRVPTWGAVGGGAVCSPLQHALHPLPAAVCARAAVSGEVGQPLKRPGPGVRGGGMRGCC